MRSRVTRLVVLVCALTGCRSYDRFSLPSPGPGAGATYEIRPNPQPLIEPGPPGSWDAVDVLNPSVVVHGGAFYNFYSGFDGTTWRTGLAVSADGMSWDKRGAVLAPDSSTWETDNYIAANGSALRHGDEFLYWYQAGRTPRIGLARSKDGRTFAKHATPVLELGPRGSWDERGVADPYVIRAGDAFFMFYLGQNRARQQRLGVAFSQDGVHWTRHRDNPILEPGGFGMFDERGLGEPAVWAAHGRYWMLYTGRDRSENRRLGLAVSQDGAVWKKTSEAPFFAGAQPWDARVVCDPSVITAQGVVRVWYGGGDVASPDERLHGRIGLFSLHATLAQ